MLTRKFLKTLVLTPFLLAFSPAIAQDQAADEDEFAGMDCVFQTARVPSVRSSCD